MRGKIYKKNLFILNQSVNRIEERIKNLKESSNVIDILMIQLLEIRKEKINQLIEVTTQIEKINDKIN